jgi:L-threonylcarbamoyladenylate synthase
VTPGEAPLPVVEMDGHVPAPEGLEQAVQALRDGLLIFPTDTLYALGARIDAPLLVRRVREAKGRGDRKPLPLVAGDLAQARLLCAAWPELAERLAAAFWPGPLTLILPASAAVSLDVTSGSGTVAVRVPALELARALCARAGPLVSTSANRAGELPPLTCAEAVAGVGSYAALALDAGAGRPLASTIVNLTSGRAELLREGAVPWSEVLGVLR